MNKVILMGRLTKDPETNQTTNSQYSRFSIAVDRRYKQDGQPTADFPSCIAWGKTSEFIDKYFHKGMKIAVEGRIQTGSYTNKDGQKVYTTDVIVEAAEFVESKNAGGDGSSSGSGSAPKVDDDGFMDVPPEIDEKLPFA